MNLNLFKTRLLTCGAAVLSLIPLFLQADDTEIYTGIAERDAPNVIFIMDTSGSMSWNNAGNERPAATSPSRLSQVQEAAIDTINNTDGINIALMKFNDSRSGWGGYVDMPMTPVAEARSTFATKLNSYVGWGGTPITESLEEALRYLRGSDLHYGRYDSTFYSHAETRSGGTYTSPISHQCQKNHIVLFSDGEPSSDTGANSRIQNLLNTVPAENRVSGLSTSCSGNGGCAEEIAFYGNQEDLNSTYDGIQNVTFHTVGGFVQGDAQTKLENIAKYGSWAAPGKPVNPDLKEGNGIYSNVQNYEQLKKSLKDIFDSIAKTSSTFTAPAVSVNAFNNLEHLDQLYYSVFKPTDSAGWSGNLKRYRLTSEGVVTDKNDDPAVDPDTGFFLATSHSFWTPDGKADGNEVRSGGAASRLTTGRKITTYFGNNKSLFATENRIEETNAKLTDALLALPATYTPQQKSTLIKWAKGIDVNDEDNDTFKDDARIFMEDPLHSQPVVINYAKDAATQTFDSSIFVATNSGYLHAISTNEEDPKEHFAFIPTELLDNIYQYFTGLSSLDKVYGMDGAVSYWHKDVNRNGVILNASGDREADEHIYLYAGMRRGGRSYYALDVSDRSDPKFLWQINNTTSGFSKLGQTWSKMTPAVVRWLGVKTKVLFFGGGYDPAEDAKSTRSTSSMGNAIYMVDATTGQLLWSTSNSGSSLTLTEMKSSIVSDIVAIDSNQDGYANVLYSADVGGRIWRLDLNNSATSAAAFAKGGIMADFNGGSSTDNIRFFNTPDIAFTRYGNFSAEGQFQISIGSGFRAHPLDTRVVNRFYILNDFNISTVPTSYSNYDEADIANLSDFSSASTAQQKAGSYYPLAGVGEKVLASSVTVANNILFTTYRPLDAIASANCDADTGLTRLYQLSPSYDDAYRDTQITDLAQGGIPPNPVILFPPQDPVPEDPTPTDPTPTDPTPEDPTPEDPTPEDGDSDCEKLKGITAIGAETVKTNISRCDQLSKSYWRIN
ncbi:MAG: type IV pilus assembly protein PilY1 [Oleispira sp.]|jgi:type IV pilus assembly protein PilY1